MNRNILLIVLCLLANQVMAQSVPSYSHLKKGQAYIMWGWNRAYYTKSNISFKGNDYDFKLYKVKAHDRPSKVNYRNYLKLDRITIPQTNFRMGYFVKKNLALSFGFDHMKYVMDQYQVVKMEGSIEQVGPHKGSYNGNKTITPDFLKFEHTDGLNYINVEAEKFYKLYHSANNKFLFDMVLGGGAGILMPRTDAKLLSYQRNDEFHIAGFGLSGKVAIQGVFFKHLVIKFENKYGYINMPDINLHKTGIPGNAKQAFFFTAIDGMIGGTFSLDRIFGGKKTKNK